MGDAVRINNKCSKDSKWTKFKYCQLSCYEAGYGYPGDLCCVDDDTPSPTPPSTSWDDDTVDDDTGDDDTGDDADWENGLTLTHYWDCSGHGTTASTVLQKATSLRIQMTLAAQSTERSCG